MSIKRTKHSQLLFPLGILIAILLLWVLSPISFQFSFWKFAGIFGPVSDLQNVFSPVNALFAGIAVLGAIYTIYTQVNLAQNQQFENVFFNLLNIHNSNARSIKFPARLMEDSKEGGHGSGERNSGPETFAKLYIFLKAVFEYVLYSAEGCGIPGQEISQHVKEYIDKQLGQSRDEAGNITLSREELFVLTYDIYTEYTDLCYSNYARHLYHTLKHVNDHSPTEQIKKIYIRILRAQLSIYEAALLYYRAITSPDMSVVGRKASKYQELIEDTAFLHLLCDDMSKLFDEGLAGKMNDTAFNSPEKLVVKAGMFGDQ